MGALLASLMAPLAVGVGVALFGRWLPREGGFGGAWGLAGLWGLGFLGWLTWPLGLIPGGYHWGPVAVGIGYAALGLWGLRTVFSRWKEWSAQRGPIRWGKAGGVALVAMSLATIMAMVSAALPSDTLEWDALAYHLALPKLWLAAGQQTEVPFIHHSYFPQVADGLFLWGLAWSGEAMAKGFSVLFLIFGAVAVGQTAHLAYGRRAAPAAITTFVGVPLVVWLSGTAYIDVAHGLYAGLGLALGFLALQGRVSFGAAALTLGGAVGSKYTGLQTLIVFGLLGLGYALSRNRAAVRPLVLTGLTALAIGAPWYARNAILTGNPVYPFFYSVLGGDGWSEFNARIYAEEQQTFGAGRPWAAPGQNYTQGPLQPRRMAHAAVGLAYQPGRYINPSPTTGQGFLIGAVGFAILLPIFAWMVERRTAFESLSLLAVGLSLLMWFFLTQQARYILSLAPLLAILMGGAILHERRKWLWGVLGLQVAITFAVFFLMRGRDQVTALIAGDPKAYREANVSFAKPAAWLNANVPKSGGVALFDEVFGYLLDIPYVWANPGHTTKTGWEAMKTGADVAPALRRLGMTHAYLNLGNGGPSERLAEAMGLTGVPRRYTVREREAMWPDLRNRWRVLMAESVARGDLRPVQGFGSKLIFEIVAKP